MGPWLTRTGQGYFILPLCRRSINDKISAKKHLLLHPPFFSLTAHQFYDQLKQTDLCPFKAGVRLRTSLCRKRRQSQQNPFSAINSWSAGAHSEPRSVLVGQNFDTPIVLLLPADGSTPAMSFSSERIS
jgi:hypothetical protein